MNDGDVVGVVELSLFLVCGVVSLFVKVFLLFWMMRVFLLVWMMMFKWETLFLMDIFIVCTLVGSLFWYMFCFICLLLIWIYVLSRCVWTLMLFCVGSSCSLIKGLLLLLMSCMWVVIVLYFMVSVWNMCGFGDNVKVLLLSWCFWLSMSSFVCLGMIFTMMYVNNVCSWRIFLLVVFLWCSSMVLEWLWMVFLSILMVLV